MPKSEVIGLVFQLLPGFMAAWIFYGLTAHPQKSPFERTVQALIFTGFIQAGLIPFRTALVWIGSVTWEVGAWDLNVAFFWSTVFAIVLGLAFSTCANTNFIHHLLNRGSDGRITRRTSYPSEWFSALYRRKRYITLHLNDGRRLFGWPEEWPDSPGSGHFALSQPEWIQEDNSRIRMDCAELLLVQASEVRMIEFEMKEISDMILAAERAAEQEGMNSDERAAQKSTEGKICEKERGMAALEQRPATIEDGRPELREPPRVSAATAAQNGEVTEFLD